MKTANDNFTINPIVQPVYLILFSIVLLIGCAQSSGWTPTVDTYGDPRAQYITQDERECKYLATQAADGSTTGQTARGAGEGAIGGAALGAIIGAIAGNAGAGAAIGAASGAFAGGAYRGISSDDKYKNAYANCMRNRGHNVID